MESKKKGDSKNPWSFDKEVYLIKCVRSRTGKRKTNGQTKWELFASYSFWIERVAPTGKSQGFGFMDMCNQASFNYIVSKLNGYCLKVNPCNAMSGIFVTNIPLWKSKRNNNSEF